MLDDNKKINKSTTDIMIDNPESKDKIALIK